LIKDIQPKYNKDSKDGRSFPYLMITTREDFPRVEVTREPKSSSVKLFGPFASAGALRGAIQVLQKIFKFRTCSLDIEESDQRWKWFRPCLLADINQCTAPCNLRISKDDYRRDIKRLRLFLDGKKTTLLKQMRDEMQEASSSQQFERAARLRDEIQMLETLDQRGKLDTHAQPEVFYTDPKKGLHGLRQVLKLDQQPRIIEGIDIAHLAGQQTVASLVHYACHPTTRAWENTLISPDYVGALREEVERATGAPCTFMQGACGDLGPRHGFVGDPEVAEANGRELAYAALSALTALGPP